MGSSLSCLYVHLVFTTKYGKSLIKENFRDRLYAYIGGIVKGEEAILLAVGGMPDHIHLVIRYKAAYAVSDLVRMIKSNSSKWVNENNFLKRRFSWQRGFGAFSVSESQVEKVRYYARTQESHHKKKSMEKEIIGLLKKHKLEYDLKYLWD